MVRAVAPARPQRFVEHAHGRRGARFLVTEERVCVQLVVRRRVLELDLIQSDLELFRQQHWHRGVRALSISTWHMIKVTRPSRPMRMKAFGAKADGVPHRGRCRRGGCCSDGITRRGRASW